MGDVKKNSATTQQEIDFKIIEAEFPKVHALISQGSQQEAEGRYRLGQLIVKVKGSAAYGSGAVAMIATEFGISSRQARYHGDVAKVWPEPDFIQLAQQRGPKGDGLSFTHLIWLAQVEDECERAELIDATLELGLTVQELKVKAGLAKPKADKAEKRRPDHVDEVVQMASELSEKLDTCGCLDVSATEMLMTLRDKLDELLAVENSAGSSRTIGSMKSDHGGVTC